jgi:hypothetical protein
MELDQPPKKTIRESNEAIIIPVLADGRVGECMGQDSITTTEKRRGGLLTILFHQMLSLYLFNPLPVLSCVYNPISNTALLFRHETLIITLQYRDGNLADQHSYCMNNQHSSQGLMD